MTIRHKPKYAVTDTVYYLVKTEAHGVRFEQWIAVYVTQCRMEATESDYTFSYVLQVNHPAAYTNGSQQINIDERVLDALQDEYEKAHQ